MFDIPEAITASSNLINGIISRIWPDPTVEEANKIEMLRITVDNELALIKTQTEINLREAGSSSIWVAGWRPFIGWVCGSALAYAAILEPFGSWLAKVAFGYAGTFPVLDTTITMQVLLGMLGLGGLRSWEKGKGVARNK